MNNSRRVVWTCTQVFGNKLFAYGRTPNTQLDFRTHLTTPLQCRFAIIIILFKRAHTRTGTHINERIAPNTEAHTRTKI